jgi:hypothetical protein
VVVRQAQAARASKQFSITRLHQVLGLVELTTRTSSLPWAKVPSWFGNIFPMAELLRNNKIAKRYRTSIVAHREPWCTRLQDQAIAARAKQAVPNHYADFCLYFRFEPCRGCVFSSSRTPTAVSSRSDSVPQTSDAATHTTESG